MKKSCKDCVFYVDFIETCTVSNRDNMKSFPFKSTNCSDFLNRDVCDGCLIYKHCSLRMNKKVPRGVHCYTHPEDFSQNCPSKKEQLSIKMEALRSMVIMVWRYRRIKKFDRKTAKEIVINGVFKDFDNIKYKNLNLLSYKDFYHISVSLEPWVEKEKNRNVQQKSA